MTSHIRYDNKKLFVEDIPAALLAEKYGTPLYVYSSNQIAEQFRILKDTFDIVPNLKFLYALKANSNSELLKLISSLGAGADTVSAGEIFLALRSGFAPDSISFAGVGKTDYDLDFALDRGIGTIIAESDEELRAISERAAAMSKTANVSLRINPDVDARTHPHISTGLKENKFGINIRDAVGSARAAAKMKNIRLVGIHSHIGSQITEVEPFAEAVNSIREFLAKLSRDGIEVSQIDLGGGIGVRYKNALKDRLLPTETSEEPSIDLRTLAKVVKDGLSSSGYEILMEPGRFLTAESGILLTRVLYRKESSGRTFVIVDAGMNDMMRHALYSAYHQVVPVELGEKAFELVDIVGPVCESTDVFAAQREISRVDRGDLLAIMTVGAYGYSLASNYNSRLKPAEILVDKDYSRIVRDRENLEDLV